MSQPPNLPDPPEGMLTYPTNRVSAHLDDPDEACGAISDLISGGFDSSNIFALTGPEGAERHDVSGKHHGLKGRLYRLIEHVGDERDELVRASEHLDAGGIFLVAPADDADDAAQAARILASHGGRRIVHFGRGHWVSLG